MSDVGSGLTPLKGSPPCRVCRKSDPILCYPDDHSQAICPDCCAKAAHPNGETGHCFEYDRHERDHACTECGIFRSCTDYQHEPHEDDIPLMTAREFRGDRPLGTPLSEISTRPGEAGYEEWVRISQSWGFN